MNSTYQSDFQFQGDSSVRDLAQMDPREAFFGHGVSATEHSVMTFRPDGYKISHTMICPVCRENEVSEINEWCGCRTERN
jgi:hypothetical protein